MSPEDVIAFTVQSLQDMNFDTEEIDADTMLGPSGADLDSLAVAELAVRIQDQYGVKFGDEDIESLAIMTLGEFAAEVAKRSELVAHAEAPR